MQERWLRPSIADADFNQQIVRRRLRVFNKNIEVAIVVENAGVQQLVLLFVARALAVGLDQVVVRIGAMRVLVEVLHVGVRGGAVEVEVVVLYVLAMITFAVGQAEKPLLKDRIFAVPQRNREAQHAVDVANPGQTVLAPAVCARARLVMREIIPGIAVLAVIFADSAPLPLAQVGTPFFPRNLGLVAFPQASALGGCCSCYRFGFFNGPFQIGLARDDALSHCTTLPESGFRRQVQSQIDASRKRVSTTYARAIAVAPTMRKPLKTPLRARINRYPHGTACLRGGGGLSNHKRGRALEVRSSLGFARPRLTGRQKE